MHGRMAQIYHAGVGDVSFPQHAVTDSGVHVASYPVGTRGFYLQGSLPRVELPVPEVVLSPASSAK
jgi:hypothetical protein